MKSIFYKMQNFRALAVLFILMAFYQTAEATSYVSNLGDVWPIAGSIGDIHALFPGGAPYGSDTVDFTTGAGRFALNSITLEFENDASYAAGLAAPQWLSIQLFEKVGNANVLVGSFGNPVANPTPTQWPQSSNPRAYTTYIDFSPLGQIDLVGLTQYSVVVGMPANSPVDAALMFTQSSSYTSAGGWTMNSTMAGNPFATGESLKFAVDARVPDEISTAVLLGGGLLLIFLCHKIFSGKLPSESGRFL